MILQNSILVYLIALPICGAFLSYLIGRECKKARDYFAIGIALCEFLFFVFLSIRYRIAGEIYSFSINNLCGLGISFMLDGFRVLYGGIASFMWLITMVCARDYFAHYRNRNRYYFFNLLTLGATIGVFLSADLFTTFLFFEIMSLASYVWVVQDEKKESMRAGATYLAIAIIGGLVMLMGLFLLQYQYGTLGMQELYKAVAKTPDRSIPYVAGLCLLFGFGAKAGAFPLHIWLPKAHPVAPAPASALLSGILTKTGIFGILILSTNLFRHNVVWGKLLLLLGVITMFLGALLALLSIDLKKTLACSSVSQIGFILVGIGMMGLLGEENALAARGTLLHMVNHSLFKLILFLSAGIIFQNIHALDLNRIRGFGRKKPLLHTVFLAGGLGITGIPFFSGYISKTLLHESIVEYGNLGFIEALFLLSGGITIAYMVKLYYCIFIEKNADAQLQLSYEEKKNYIGHAPAIGLLFTALLIPFMGMFPQNSMNNIAEMGATFLKTNAPEHIISYFSLINLQGAFISIVIGMVLYFTVVRIGTMRSMDGKIKEYKNLWPAWIDLEDKIYRPIFLGLLPLFGGVISRICDSAVDFIVITLRKTIYRERKLPHELEEGNVFTHGLGTFLDKVTSIKNKILKKETGKQVSYIHRLAVLREMQMENNTLIGRSLSFGLFMFCFGLGLTLIYLLF